MTSKSFRCIVCEKDVVSIHMHTIQNSFCERLSAITGKKLRVGGLCCCAHFEPHARSRFTRLHPAKLIEEYGTPYFVSPSTRKSRVLERPRDPVQVNVAPRRDRQKKADARVEELQKRIEELESRIIDLDRPLLARLVPKLSSGAQLGAEDAESLRYWTGIRSPELVLQFLDAFPSERRGRLSKLSDLDWITVTLMWLRRGLPQKALALFTSVDRSNVTRHVEDVIDYMNMYA